jgi:hypothetical protein
VFAVEAALNRSLQLESVSSLINTELKKLTPCRILPEKLIMDYLVKKVHDFDGTKKIIAVFTRVHNKSLS